jgi:acetyl-CoA acetyltransferase
VQIQLHADAALNAMADADLKPADIDGIATAGETPVTVAHYLGITPKWVDGTAVGGCSFMIHVRHAAAAIASGLCDTVLITHGESGRSAAPVSAAPAMLWRRPASPASSSSPMGRADGPADFVHDPGIALHEELWALARAIGDGLGRAARMGGEEPARDPRATGPGGPTRGRRSPSRMC